MATAVASRSIDEIKTHAFRYMLVLQAHAPRALLEQALGAETSSNANVATWSAGEDAIFEQALAHTSETDPARWEKIAELLPGRSAGEVAGRYQILLVDVAKTQLGEVIIVPYSSPR